MKLSKETQIYLRNLIVCYEQKPHGSEVIFPNAPRKPCEEEKKYPSAEKYLLPPVILWDPFMQYPNVFDDGLSCPHDSHASEAREHLTAKKWKDGHSERDAPRKLYGRDVVLSRLCLPPRSRTPSTRSTYRSTFNRQMYSIRFVAQRWGYYGIYGSGKFASKCRNELLRN